MNTRISPYRILIFSMMLILIAACQPKTEGPDTPEGGATSESSTAGSSTDPGSPMVISKNLNLDPALAQDADSLKVSSYLYEGLVRLDSSGAAQPALAESWVISDDLLDYIFTLRPGIAFSDGAVITPDIIADNFNRWFDPLSPLRGTGDYKTWENIFLGFHGEKDDDDRAKSTVDGIQKVDVNTVLIHLNRPIPDFLTYIANPAFAILQPAALDDPAYGSRTSTIISSGPYVVANWTDSSLVLSPNSQYWGTVPQGNVEFKLQ